MQCVVGIYNICVYSSVHGETQLLHTYCSKIFQILKHTCSLDETFWLSILNTVGIKLIVYGRGIGSSWLIGLVNGSSGV